MASERNLFETPQVKDSRDLRGLVVSVVDPLMEGRIAVIIPRVMPNSDPNMAQTKEKTNTVNKDILHNTELTGAVASTAKSSNQMWARPCRNASTGNFRVPYKGQTIYCYMEDGDPSKLYYKPYGPTLSGEVIAMDEVRASGDVFSPEKKPFIHVYDEFNDGTTIYYNENAENRELHCKFSNGFTASMESNPKAQRFELTTDLLYTFLIDQLNKKILTKCPNGHTMLIDAGEAPKISVTTASGHVILLDDSEKPGAYITTAGGHVVNVDDSAGTITATASTGGTVVIGNGKVMIN